MDGRTQAAFDPRVERIRNQDAAMGKAVADRPPTVLEELSHRLSPEPSELDALAFAGKRR